MLPSNKLLAMLDEMHEVNGSVPPELKPAGLGMGAYSKVFKIIDPKTGHEFALKVSKGADVGCTTYLRACMNKKHPSLPRVYWIGEGEVHGKLRCLMPVYKKPPKEDSILEGSSEKAEKFRSSVQERDGALNRLLQNCIRSQPDSRLWVDVHNGNVMMDEAGNLVLTDPLAGGD